jgi:transketolase
MRTFGASAPLKDLQKKFGFDPGTVVAAAREQVALYSGARRPGGEPGAR